MKSYPYHLDSFSELIIDILSIQPWITVSDLDRELLLKYDQEFSLATLYRRLAELIARQILVRDSSRYALSPIWINQLELFLSKVKSKSHFFPSSDRPFLSSLPTRKGGKRIYRAESLLQLNSIWNALLLDLGSLPGEGLWYGYNSHAWFALGTFDSEIALFDSLKKANIETKFFIGGKSPLDLIGLEKMQSEKIPVVPKRINHQRYESDSALWASQNYIIEFRLPGTIAKRFSNLFNPRYQVDELDKSELIESFALKEKCQLTVKRDPKLAKQLRLLLS